MVQSSKQLMSAASTQALLLLLSVLCATTLLPTYTAARPLSARQLRGNAKDNLVEIPAETFQIPEGEELAAKKPRPAPNNSYWEQHALPVVQLTLGAPYVKPSPRPRSWMQDLTSSQPQAAAASATAASPTVTASSLLSTAGGASNGVNHLEDRGDLKPNNASMRKQIWPLRNVTVIYAKMDDTLSASNSHKNDKMDKNGTSDKSGDKSSRKLLSWNMHEMISNANRKLLAGVSSSSSSSNNSVYALYKVHVFVANYNTSSTAQARTGTADTQVPKEQQTNTTIMGVVTNSVSTLSAGKVTVIHQQPAWMAKHEDKVFASHGVEQPAAASSRSSSSIGSSDGHKAVHMFVAKRPQS